MNATNICPRQSYAYNRHLALIILHRSTGRWRTMMGLLDAVGGFAKGVGEGAWDGVKGTVAGVGHLAEDGYKLATDGKYREQTWNSALNMAKAAGNFAETAVTDPGKAADEIGTTASHAWHALETSYHQAAAHGQGSEFIGQL